MERYTPAEREPAPRRPGEDTEAPAHSTPTDEKKASRRDSEESVTAYDHLWFERRPLS